MAVIPNRNRRPILLIRTSQREGKKTIKETLANITRLPKEVVRQIRVLLRGGTAVETIKDAFEIVRSRPHGHVAAILGEMRQLGLSRRIDRKDSRNRRSVIC